MRSADLRRHREYVAKLKLGLLAAKACSLMYFRRDGYKSFENHEAIRGLLPLFSSLLLKNLTAPLLLRSLDSIGMDAGIFVESECPFALEYGSRSPKHYRVRLWWEGSIVTTLATMPGAGHGVFPHTLAMLLGELGESMRAYLECFPLSPVDEHAQDLMDEISMIESWWLYDPS